jgi:DNA-binding NarL/FixJ family response regulator
MNGAISPESKPGLILLNPVGGLCGEWALSALHWLKKSLPRSPVIMLSDCEEPERLDKLLNLGVRGYLPPSAEPDVVFAAVRLVQAGGTHLPIQIHGGTSNAARKRRVLRDLSPRELAVIKLVRDGRPNKRIATALNIEEGTVKAHVRNIMRKFRVFNRVQLALIANQLFDPVELNPE